MIKGKGYGITEENLLGHEMIGLKVKVIKSTDKKREGTEGKIVDETQKTFRISAKKIVTVPKKECEFEFDLGEEKRIINGREIMKRPEDRIKDFKN
jgi:ribonuclease P protein subunit POP4